MAAKIIKEPMYAYYNQYSGAVVLESTDADKWMSSQKLDKYLREEKNGMTKSNYDIKLIHLTIEIV